MGTEYKRLNNKSPYEQGLSINPTLSNKTDLGKKYAPQSPIIKLQRNLGNQAMQRMFSTDVIQAKLKISQPGDKYEQEADRVADEVMRMPEHQSQVSEQVSDKAQTTHIQRICDGCEGGGGDEELIQAKTTVNATPEVTPAISAGIQSLQGGGRPLSVSVRSFFESCFGADFSNVRVHNSARAANAAQSVNARAFTHGCNVVFGAGQYAPQTNDGRTLLAHELSHVIQQQAAMPLVGHKQGKANSAVVQLTHISNHHLQRREQREGEMMPMSAAEFRDEVIFETQALVTANAPTLSSALQRTIEGSTAIPSLVALLTEAQRRSVGQRYSEQLNSIAETAALLVQTFILDPNTSSLDLLPEAQRNRVRNFNWEEHDYPGGSIGANEGRARQMSRRLSVIRPERRANSGANAVVTRAQHTTAVERHIRANLVAIPAFPAPAGDSAAPNQRAGHQLYRNAQAEFMNMRVAALRDGVPLIVLSSYRDPAVAAARARAAGNPAAIASFSSHSLGLAVDLKMSLSYEDASGGQQNVRFTEITTTPMQNVVDMRESPVHKWIFLHGAEYGWFPYQNESWHWEYNPVGFSNQFDENLNSSQP